MCIVRPVMVLAAYDRLRQLDRSSVMWWYDCPEYGTAYEPPSGLMLRIGDSCTYEHADFHRGHFARYVIGQVGIGKNSVIELERY